MYMLKADSHHVRVSVLLNDVPMLSLSGMDLSNDIGLASPWIEDGANVIQILIQGPSAIPDDAGGAVILRDSASCVAQVIRMPPGFTGGEVNGEVLGEARWRHDPKAPASGLPIDVRGQFSGQAMPGMRWRNSRLPDDPVAAWPHLIAWLRNLFDALAYGQVDLVLAARRPGLLDICNAMGIDPESQVAEFGEMLREIAAGAKLLPFADADIRARTVANGRLLECTRADGTPLLRSAPDSAIEFEMATRVGMIGGQWWLI